MNPRDREASTANSLLAALPDAAYQRLLARLDPVTLEIGELLHEPHVPFRDVYFPIDCVVSLLATVDGHHASEVALVGREGMIGIPLGLGIRVSSHRALVQTAGTAMRMKATLFRQEILRNKPLQQTLHQYKHALFGQIAQCAACNLFHSSQARLARYLLMTADRARSREIRLKQEFLARMLGVHRAAITNAASVLQKRMLIKYRRGQITIVDPRGLGSASCECYRTIRRIYETAYADA